MPRAFFLRTLAVVTFAGSAVAGLGSGLGCGSTGSQAEAGRSTTAAPETKTSDEPDPEAKPGPEAEPTPPDDPPAVGDLVNPVNQLLVTHTPEGGAAIEVALIQFDDRHHAHPFPIVADTAAYEPFAEAWKTISAKEKLTWKHHDESGLTGTDHGPGDYNYIFGVEQAIGRTPGLSVAMGSGVGLKAERGGTTVGVVNVVDNAHGKVYVLSPGPDGDALVAAWSALEGKDTLPMDSHTNTAEGREYGTKLVPKGNEEYPWAVWSSLESGHGFLMDAL